MKKPKFVWVAVDPDFRKKLKMESMNKDLSMIKYTKYLATGEFNLEENFKNYKKKGGYNDPFKI